MQNKDKKNWTLYAITNAKNEIYYETIKKFKKDSIEEFLTNETDAFSINTWEQAKKNGYKCVKVFVYENEQEFIVTEIINPDYAELIGLVKKQNQEIITIKSDLLKFKDATNKITEIKESLTITTLELSNFIKAKDKTLQDLKLELYKSFDVVFAELEEIKKMWQ